MGANESTSLLPYPPSWLPSTTTPVQHRQAVAALKSLSSVQANPPVEPLTRIDVLGKTADAVCQEIIKALGDAPSMGCVLVLQGLSGTGKGTTCSLLEQKLPRCTSWSNGNVRSKHQTRARSSCCDARPRGVAMPRTLAGGLGRMLTLKNHLHADALCPCPTNDTMSMARRSFDL